MKKKLIMEGGNLILRSQEGQIVAAAEKIDFSSISRRRFLSTFRRFFIIINKIHKNKFKQPIWPDTKHLYTGRIFNGSAQFLFNDKINDSTFKNFKPSVGDVDITVPEKHEKTFRKILEALPKISGEIIDDLKYIGEKESKRQILFLFEYQSENGPKSVQADFEFVEYDNDTPTLFESFVHSASWQDIKHGLKGSLHKILIQSIAKGVSRIKNGKILTHVRGTQTTAQRHRNAAMYSFSVPEGLRIKYKPEPDRKGAYRFQPASASERIQDVSKIFFHLFKNKPKQKDLKEFSSFIGTLNLIKRYYNKQQIDEIFETFIIKIYHRNFGMTIDRRMTEDQISKSRAVEIFYEKFSFLKKYKEKVETMSQVFYNTTTFKEKGNIDKDLLEKYL